jgi:hypothetical protein
LKGYENTLNTNNRRRNTQNGNSNSSSNRSFLSLGSNLKIGHINIERISIYLRVNTLLAFRHDEDLDIVTVQETHAGSEIFFVEEKPYQDIHWLGQFKVTYTVSQRTLKQLSPTAASFIKIASFT